jgi:hypothetical protein
MAKTEKQTQVQHFIETARALGCDEDKERFEEALGKFARHKPPPDGPKHSKKTKTKNPGQ